MKNLLLGAVCSFFLFLIACNGAKPADAPADASATKDTTMTAPAEFADMKYGETVKGMVASLSKGDMASWLGNFSDNAVYAWNNGDSLAGKAAISEYWTKRRGDVIDSLWFDKQIYLPVKVNKPQSIEAPGVWVLSWYEVTAKYKPTGKSMTQWIHSDAHFDANGKVDRWIQYSDRAVINAAMTK
jgi:hypothetical protein